jgi:hypothetical protein
VADRASYQPVLKKGKRRKNKNSKIASYKRAK